MISTEIAIGGLGKHNRVIAKLHNLVAYIL